MSLAFPGCLCGADLAPSYRKPSTTSIEKPLPIFPAARAGLTLPIKVGGFPGCNPPTSCPGGGLKNNDSLQCHFWSC